MAGRRILADTNIFVEHLRARDKKSTALYRLESHFEVETSAVVAAEIFYGARTLESEQQAQSVFAPIIIHPFTADMAARNSSIMRDLVANNRLRDLRDVMIAASAIELGMRLSTRNRSHFDGIPGSEIEDIPDA